MDSFILSGKFIELMGSPALSIYECEFSPALYSDTLFSEFNIEFPVSLNNSVDKRKSEFLAGRYACKNALQRLGLNNSNVGIGQHRCPIWPAGVRGSISHTSTIALCVVSDSLRIENIGIDHEQWLSPSSADKLMSHIISKNEKSYLLGKSLPFNELLTITFSAKESLFKALYPRVGQYFYFHAASIVSISTSGNQGRFVFKLQRSLLEYYPDDLVEGEYYIDGGSITTIIVLSYPQSKIINTKSQNLL